MSVVLLGLAFATRPAYAQTTTFGPSPYLSAADIPAGLYEGGSPTFLEDFEDDTLDGGITASGGTPRQPSVNTDSVDADDGSIDGFGTAGHSYIATLGPAVSTTFSFASPVTAAGIVVTQKAAPGLTVEAVGPGNVVLASIQVTADGNTTTAEDRFVGFSDPGGLVALRLLQANATEIDHIQYGVLQSSSVVGGFAGGEIAIHGEARENATPRPFGGAGWAVIVLLALLSAHFGARAVKRVS